MMNARQSFNPRGFALILATAVVAIIAGLYFLRPPTSPPMEPDDYRKAIEIRNRALGRLENKEYALADSDYQQLSAWLPQEELPARNLAITRVMLLTEGGIDRKREPERWAAAWEEARLAIAAIRKLAPDSPISHLLAGKRAGAAGDVDVAMQEYRAAAAVQPQSAALWYELFSAGQYARDPATRDASLAALKQAHGLEPENLFALVDLLLAQVDVQDASIGETLDAAQGLVKPFAEDIRRVRRFDTVAAIDNAIQAAHSGTWSAVAGNVRPVCSLLRPEIASKIDERRISRHLLEYVALDFSSDFYRKAQAAGAVLQALPDSDPSNIVVRFERAGTSEQFPDLKNVQDAAVEDFDLDGRVDLIIVRDNRVEVWGRDEAGRWIRIAESDELPGIGRLRLADFDRDFDRKYSASSAGQPTSGQPVTIRSASHNVDSSPDATTQRAAFDADLDVVAFGSGGIYLLRNERIEGESTRRLTTMPQVDGLRALRNVSAVATSDLEHDGDLDLAVSAAAGVSLWINRENFTFADGADFSQLPDPDRGFTSIVPVDWNNNIAVDLMLCGADSGVVVLENILHGRFRRSRVDGLPSDLPNPYRMAVGDVDGNGSWDLITAGEGGISVYRTTLTAADTVASIESAIVSETAARDIRLLDYNNDGRIDLVGWNETAPVLLTGSANGRFEADTDALAAGETDSTHLTTCAVGDIDGDGDEDLVVVRSDSVEWLTNEGGNTNAWCDIVLRPEPNPEQFPSQRVNMHGFGSEVEVLAGGSYQARIVTRPVTHFGLGRTSPETIRVIWTDGVPQHVLDPVCGEPIVARQDLKGSCPYLYAWNGQEFVFVTDCLWAAPLGLQAAEGVLVPSREWEYLKIPGTALQRRDGRYQLRITEELWEAVYFDEIRLFAVDHPDDVEVFTNEKVGPADIAGHRIHTVRDARTPRAARDTAGDDLLPLISKRDEQYARTYSRRFKQGLVDRHVLELDLGELVRPERITLFLTGWIFPTDTSINIAISQNPNLEPPKPPSLEVPDEDGEWTETIPFTGFPGGKTKTIAIDLSNAFLTDDYRLRIVSSQELYWDHVFFTVDEQPADVRTRKLALLEAELRYHGFCAPVRRDGNAPVIYDYESVSTQPRWSPMQGRFTRYGPVGELLSASDARLVVMAAGDEIRLDFQAIDDPPPGWRRDFVIYNVGWDKDADVNTIYGQSSEPYPFPEMSGYPFAPDEPVPNGPGWQQYLDTWQTRRQPLKAFRRAVLLQRNEPP